MNKYVCVIFCLALFLPLVYAGSAGAADDDTQASVYLVFDPETGEFVTVHDPSVTAQHQAQQEQEAIDSVADTTGAASESPETRVIGVVLLVLLLGGAVWLHRNR